MATLSLRIHIVDGNVTKTMQFDPSTTVYEICNIIRDKIVEAGRGEAKDYGLFLADEDAKKGVWLEPGRSLEYYILRNGDLVMYRKKLRTLKVQMLDGTVKTMMIDDSQPVANLMVVICTKLGITNHDEYGLIREIVDDECDIKNPNYGTLTIRRKREEKDRDVKMDHLRKKLKTDDELNWVDVSKTLREQGINEGEPVLLRRKFFFSDGNIDSHDPVQLNLLYVQARDAILDGTHPVTEDLACRLAGLQVHIQFGNHNEVKHKPLFLDLKEFLPNSYIKVKNIEKKIFAEHKTHYGLSELDAKLEYTKTCRSLPTYGVTFFLVKEKQKGKNKLVPRLLGVNKDSVLRLDERTKEILKVWPLTTVRRWGASPNTFTLDFGDYSDDYYSVQTKEAEQILQIIAGYIDIILKKKRAKDHLGIEGDEGSTMIEEMVSPCKASIFLHETNKVGKVNMESVAKPAIMRAGTDGSKPYRIGHMSSAKCTSVSEKINISHAPVVLQQSQVTNITNGSQKALVSTIDETRETIETVEAELMEKIVIPDAASSSWKEITVNNSRQHVSSRVAAMNAATAQIITMTSNEMDYTAVEEAIHSITTNLPEMSENVRMLAALSPSGDNLLDAARKLCSAFTDLLNAVQTQSSCTNRQSLLSAASRVGEASRLMINELGTNQDESKDMLLSVAKAVANTTAALVVKAKSVAATVEQPQQSEVINAATKCALATSQLVACTKVVVSTVENPSCREQLVIAAQEVMNAMEDLVKVCGLSVPENNILLKDLIGAVSEVTTQLNRLISQVKVSKPAFRKPTTFSREEEMMESSIMEQYETDSPVIINGTHTSEINQYIEEKQSVPQSPPVKYYTATVSKVIYNISQAMHRVSDTSEYSRACDSVVSNYEYHNRMINTSKEIARVTQEMMSKPWSDDNKFDISLSHNYSQLTNDCINFVSSEPNQETGERLSSSVRDLGSACINAVKVAASTPTTNSYSCCERTEKAKDVAEKVSHVLGALQACSRGTQACNNAANTVSGIIGDLDTIIMFATAGTLHSEKENETFADHRENILKTAKALVEDTKTLVAGAASSQEELAVAAQNAVSTITQLAEVVKYGAASLGSDNPESQVMLINAVRDVANALGDLIQATKSASGKGVNDPSMYYLKESARVMVTNLTSLLKTVKVVEDEHSRGTRALESTIEAITQEIRALSSPSGSNLNITPEELMRSTKAITLATAKAVAAGNSCKQEDVIIAANMGRKAISDMLSICKACAINAESEELRHRALTVGKETATHYRELLQIILNILRPSPTVIDPKQTLPQASRNIAQWVTELVAVAESLKGKDWVSDDPTMIAENELLGAAASIDAAARKLASLKPRKCILETDESLNFNEMILEAAKSIAAATSALIKAASAAQRELVDSGKVSRMPLNSSDDGQWSEGLISAARLVAAATHSLVEAANALVNGVASEEKLISAARQVASSTAQLLVACKVKADPDSDTTKRLQAAGNAVKRATDNLVRAARQVIQHDEERSLKLNKKMVGGIAQEIDARSEILRIERELEEARTRLTAIRLAKYKLRGDGTVYEDDSVSPPPVIDTYHS